MGPPDDRLLIMERTLLLLAALAGCAASEPTESRPAPPPLSGEPISLQIQRAEPRLAGYPFRVLLDFERNSDLAFLTDRSPADLVFNHGHTGGRCLKLDGSLEVHLSSVLGGRFPGAWTIAGGYFYSDSPRTITIACAAGGKELLPRRAVTLTPGKWTAVWIDLSPLAAHHHDAGAMLGFLADGPDVLVDDVIVLNNTRVFDAPADDASGWTVAQSGFATLIQRTGKFRLALRTPEAAVDGWNLEEANALRARFVSASGKCWTIYNDGRQYVDGQFQWLGPAVEETTALARQHDSPAEIQIGEDSGRIDRSTPGDVNNDGYNERRGAYQLAARTSWVEFQLSPRTRTLCRPVVEISGLKEGRVTAWVCGQLVDNVVRLPDGKALLELPLSLGKPATISIGVK